MLRISRNAKKILPVGTSSHVCPKKEEKNWTQFHRFVVAVFMTHDAFVSLAFEPDARYKKVKCLQIVLSTFTQLSTLCPNFKFNSGIVVPQFSFSNVVPLQ